VEDIVTDGMGMGSDNDLRGSLMRLARQGADWLRARSAEHWLMFLGGLALGLLLG
jgi:hypothetical protein